MWKRIRAFIEKHLSARNDFGPDLATDAGPVAKPPPAAETVIMATRAVPEGEPPVATPDAATEEQTTRVDSEAEILTLQMGDTRRALVNVFEYTYGALLPLLIFCFLIYSADPAQEVLIGFLADAQPVVQEFDAANLIAGDSGFDRFEQLLSPAFLALAALFCLPVAAHGLAFLAMKLYGRYGVQEGSERVVAYDMKVAEYVYGCILLIGCIGISAAFFKAMASEEALAMGLTQMPGPVIILIIALALYAALFSPFKMVSTLARLGLALLFKKSGQDRLIMVLFGLVGLVTFLLLVAVAFTLIAGFFDPHSHLRLGPVALVAIFFIALMCLLVGLTSLSIMMPGNFPLVLFLPLLAMASSTIFASIAGAGLVLGAIYLVAKHGPAERRGRGIVVFVCAFLLLPIYAYLHTQTERCGSLAGCNLIEGVARTPDAFTTIADTLPHVPTEDPQSTLRVIAAQGGGLYAAYHAAYYLAARTDIAPAFADSIFAISGVSGGSVGAGVYWAIETSGYCDGAAPNDDGQITCRRDAVDFILRRDYLTAAAATLLFRDALDTFVPVSSVQHLRGKPLIDRGRVLEREVEWAVAEWLEESAPSPAMYQAVVDALAEHGLSSDTPLSMPISASAWGLLGRKETEPALAPLLFLNGTRVHDGAKVVATPVQSVGINSGNLNLEGGRDLTVINGMVMSARFPGVTPPARVLLELPENSKDSETTHVVQLADGGYFDNSGLETAIDIVNEIQSGRAPAQGQVPSQSQKIEIIALVDEERPTSPVVSGTLGAPLAAFMGAWRERGAQSARRVDELFLDASGVSACEANTDPYPLNFTVSWYLSRASFNEIANDVAEDIHRTVSGPPQGSAGSKTCSAL